ncbi:periplasmic heavy metal sensor [Acidocella sp.]|uniref:periplasmic heavy metal sensor n=1 Tax=Acidocella sp. TaxID=50710 RepID=UPI003CFC5458
MRSGMRWLLAGSLLLNLLLLGFGGTVAWRLRHGAVGLVEGAMIRPLHGQDKRIMRQAFLQARPEARAAQARMRAAHLAVDTALRAEPFDPAALQTALTSWRLATDAFLASFEAPLLRGAGAVSPQGRRGMAALGDKQARRAARGVGP